VSVVPGGMLAMTIKGPWGTKEPQRGPNRGWIWLVVALAAAGVLALLAGTVDGLEAEHVYRAVVVIVFGGSAVVYVAHRLRGRYAQGLIYAAIWLGVVLALALGYAYRGAFRDIGSRLMLEFMPGATAAWAPGVVRVSADRSGHYLVEAMVNGTPVRFLVDTGATNVSLTARDAQRVGIDLAKLNYDRVMETAAGRVRAASVRLDRVAIGQIEIRDVAGSVNRSNEGISLLGMSFLSRLTGFAVEEGYLVLRQ
jgi:aspartyl protease family protein